MKNQSFLYSLLVVLICLCTAKSFAHDIEVKNIDGVTIYYSWRNNETELAVDYFGDDDVEPSRGFYSGEIFIPESVEYGGKTYIVTAIDECAFVHCMGLTSVTIPNTVTYIGDRAFADCSSLNSVTIPNGVTFIANEAFCFCGSLISIKVESGNQTYDSRDNCNAIIEKSSNTLIAGCKNTIIPNTVTSIGYRAFFGCRGLTSVTIPNSVTSIGSWAFEDCGTLISITIPNSVTSVGFNAFYETAWYNNQPVGLVYAGKVAYQYKGTMPANTSISLKEGTVGIAGGAFETCSGLSSITIPNSVTSIGGTAFWGCSGLTSVTIPSSVTSIGYSAFFGCSGLTSICSEIENPFTIDDSVFGGIPSNAQLIVPKGTKDKYQATAGWNRYTNIVEVGGVGYEFEADGINYRIGEDNTVSVIYKKGEYSGDVVIPSSVVYQGNTYSVTSIGSWAFAFCDDLTSVTIPNSVTYIGDDAFQECSLTSITIPNSVTDIRFEAFRNCGLTSVTIPSSVRSIGYGAFFGCNLTTITSEIKNPFEIEEVFSSDAQLIVPKGTKAAYQATEGWNQFTNIMEAGEEPDLPGQIHINDIFYKLTGSGEAEVVSVEEGETSVTIPSTISYNNNTYKVTSTAKEVFENREHLAAVIWEPEAQFNAKVNNPNFLLYVSDEKYASHTVKNVVVNGVAENIELTDAANGNDFYCPKAFKAKSIIYSHNFQMETGLGDSRGWETIVLPFDVQKYTHATKGELESFTTWANGSNKKPFWLFELTASGYKDAAGIKANTPYIISLPNNQQYEQQYQIPGVVTFSASDVEVQESDNLKPVSYQGRSFVPNYTNQNNADFLALNVSNNYVTNPSKEIAGSKFIRGLRAVHPFEAYITTTDNTRSIDVIDGMTTAIRGIQMVKDESSTIKVYDTRGVLLKFASNMDDVRNGLKSGVYIVNGKKIIIK